MKVWSIVTEVLYDRDRKRASGVRVLDALTTHYWNKQRAANAQGTSRTTLIAKMQRMGIAIQKP